MLRRSAALSSITMQRAHPRHGSARGCHSVQSAVPANYQARPLISCRVRLSAAGSVVIWSAVGPTRRGNRRHLRRQSATSRGANYRGWTWPGTSASAGSKRRPCPRNVGMIIQEQLRVSLCCLLKVVVATACSVRGQVSAPPGQGCLTVAADVQVLNRRSRCLVPVRLELSRSMMLGVRVTSSSSASCPDTS